MSKIAAEDVPPDAGCAAALKSRMNIARFIKSKPSG